MGLFDNGIPDFTNPLDIAFISAMCEDEEEENIVMEKVKKRKNGQNANKNDEIDDENEVFSNEELEFYDLMDEDEEDEYDEDFDDDEW